MDAIDLTQYLPQFQQAIYRKADESLYSRYTFQESPMPLDNLYANYMNLNKPGVPMMWRKEYWQNSAWCTQTYGALFKGEDKSVTETGDYMPSSVPCQPNTILGYKTNTGTPTGLQWSGPGGLSDVPAVVEMNVWRQNSPGAAYTDSGSDAYSKTGLVAHHVAFTPEYGRDEQGVWRKGGAMTYYDVVHLVMYHGTKTVGRAKVRCDVPPPAAEGAYYQDYKEYNSYAMEMWFARDVGLVQERTTFIADGGYWGMTNCRGHVFEPTAGWTTFIDTAPQ